MNDIPDSPAPQSDRWPVRVWPGVAIVLIAAVVMIVPGLLMPRTMVHFFSMILAPVVGAIAVVVWWAVAARVKGRDRWLYPALLVVPGVILGATLFRDKAVVVPFYGVPVELVLWVGWLVVTAGLTRGPRRVGLALALLAGWGVIAQLRLDGASAEMAPELRWWWQKTAEKLADEERANRPKGIADGSVVVNPGDWPAFRGAKRDGIRTGVTIDTDWEANPPQQLWKHRIGPGWGSFAVVGNRLYTQEQRGNDEAVVCLAADTGLEVWAHLYPGRFEEAIGGAGPRATPTVQDGRVYAQGATGKLLCLDAATGKPHWTADVVTDAGGIMPQWGFSSSPLVTEGVVIVYAGGPHGKGAAGTAAFHADTGKVAWLAGKATHSYSSAHPVVITGTPQVLMVSDYGVESFQATTGQVLWEHVWNVKGANRVTQPTILGGPDLVIGTGVGSEQGSRRLRVWKEGDKWNVQALWTSRAMKPYFNDGVAYKGHLFGFDDSRLSCIDLETGELKWKEGRYGHGQVLLLADQGVLVVQGVDGKVALVEANPDDFIELAKFQAIEKKTWNHPVVAHGMLFVRNGQWAAGYKLKTK